ncbi:MAG: helix-turn-helix domain-containing protein [Daejeonella sp.]
MSVEIITKEDLQEFREQLLLDIRQILRRPIQEAKQWLKSYEVRKLLSISPNTLHALRQNGTLRYTKIGGMLYYKYEDIMQVLEGNGK